MIANVTAHAKVSLWVARFQPLYSQGGDAGVTADFGGILSQAAR
jgi:hypothetical protein